MMKSGLVDFECEEGYPTDHALDGLRRHEFTPHTAVQFLIHDLPRIKEGISCLSVSVEDGGGLQPIAIEYHTGGWSGAEELIDAMLGHFWIRHLHTKWERGGHFYFEVPVNLLESPQLAERHRDAP